MPRQKIKNMVLYKNNIYVFVQRRRFTFFMWDKNQKCPIESDRVVNGETKSATKQVRKELRGNSHEALFSGCILTQHIVRNKPNVDFPAI